MEKVQVTITNKHTGESFVLQDFNEKDYVPTGEICFEEELSKLSDSIKLENNVLKVLEKQCLIIDNKLQVLNSKKTSLVDSYLSNKYECDCSGIYKLSLLSKRCGNSFEPLVVRNVLLNREPIHTFDNDKVQNLIKSDVLSVTKSWIDEGGEFHHLTKEDLEELLEHKNYNPVTGEDYDKDEEVWSDSECKFITRGQWIVESIVPILHLNADVVEDIKKLLETK